MTGQCLVNSQLFRALRYSLAMALILICRGAAAEPLSKAASPDTGASGLVQAALEKELAGDNSRREALLQGALDQSPNDPAAHWQLGQVRVKDKWQSPAEVERAAQQDKRLAEYAKRRNVAGPDAVDQVALAQWCRRNRLDDQQRVHWISALQFEPDNVAAIRGLGLRPFLGTMATPAQIQRYRDRFRRVSKAAERWRPLVAQWLAAIEKNNAVLADELREKLCRISDSSEMLGLEQSLWQQVGAKGKKQELHRMVLAVVLALADNPHPAAAEALVRGAVFSEHDNVRSTAIAGLKRHPLDHHVPLLLTGLQAPIEADMRCSLSAAGDLITGYSLSQEGALSDLSVSITLSPVYPLGGALPDPRMRAGMQLTPGQLAQANAVLVAVSAANYQVNAERAMVRADQQEAALRKAVEQTNRTNAQRNARIEIVLSQTTGQDLGESPTKWWDWWWQDYNESYDFSGGTDGEGPAKPQEHYDYNLQYPGSPPTYRPTGRVFGCSCFALGTKVWTLTGRQVIEKVKIGDCVLAQDVDSGELAYKPVLAVTVRKPGPRMKIGVGPETIVATPSHPFWVLGQGWRMTKQLAVGDRFHTTRGAVRVQSIAKVDPDPADARGSYNLIVADFNSYFVGEQGILVHDTTPRAPTAAIVPGLAQQVSRDSAR